MARGYATPYLDQQKANATLSCNAAIDLFGAYLAQELAGDSARDFVEHLRRCDACHDKLLALELYLHISAADCDRESGDAVDDAAAIEPTAAAPPAPPGAGRSQSRGAP